MARKKAPPSPPRPSRERVQAALEAGEFTAALSLARELHALAPSPENLALLKNAVSSAATAWAMQNKIIDFNHTMEEADRIDPENPEWAAERACLLACGGRLSDALMRADEATRPRVLGHAADRALRFLSKEFLPDEIHPGFDSVMQAFQCHERGDEAGARAALEPIGLRSPFLEWKVLLRGLLAHAAGDEARAAENFARLDLSRLPHKLASPFRAALDPAWRASLPPSAADLLTTQYGMLSTSAIVEGLRGIARNLGRGESLQKAFRIAEALAPKIKHQMPQLLPKLASCFYQAILTQGQPDDLGRYRKVFGGPPDDPSFFKLQARIAEQVGNLEMVQSFWKKYDDWLGTNPAGWSPDLLARARAVVWIRLGKNAEDMLDDPNDLEEVGDPFDLFAPPQARRKPKARQGSKATDLTASECYRRAFTLAPGWNEPAGELFEILSEKSPEEAEEAARLILHHQPDNLAVLAGLGGLLLRRGKAEEAIDMCLKARALNPLDKKLETLTVRAIFAQCRRLLMEASTEDAEKLLANQSEMLQQIVPASHDALASIVAMKMKRPDEAAACRDRAAQVAGARLLVAYCIAVDSQLARLKPAEKKAAEQAFAAELAHPQPTPLEVAYLMAAYENYLEAGINYRGQKTHEKKMLLQADKCIGAQASELDFEMLVGCLDNLRAWKRIKKMCNACMSTFPDNPCFRVWRVIAGLELKDDPYYLRGFLAMARRLAESSSVPRFRELLPEIEELQKNLAPSLGFDPFRSLFGRR